MLYYVYIYIYINTQYTVNMCYMLSMTYIYTQYTAITWYVISFRYTRYCSFLYCNIWNKAIYQYNIYILIQYYIYLISLTLTDLYYITVYLYIFPCITTPIQATCIHTKMSIYLYMYIYIPPTRYTRTYVYHRNICIYIYIYIFFVLHTRTLCV